jgi:hypothetical protein
MMGDLIGLRATGVGSMNSAFTCIQSVTQFPDDPFTGSSTVATGAFYNK